jgi:hypothetical protein
MACRSNTILACGVLLAFIKWHLNDFGAQQFRAYADKNFIAKAGVFAVDVP